VVVVDAVDFEPVSTAVFPANREIAAKSESTDECNACIAALLAVSQVSHLVVDA
jgi:hypothetical protein